jgi:hypothetical protein
MVSRPAQATLLLGCFFATLIMLVNSDSLGESEETLRLRSNSSILNVHSKETFQWDGARRIGNS